MMEGQISRHRPRFVPRGITPTHEQRLIQLSQQRISLIEAGAGAAKTTTLALRVAEALVRGLPPEQILIWVFTHEAVEVFKARLLALGVAPRLVQRLRIGTVERFAHSVWDQWGERDVPRHHSLSTLQDPILQALDDCSAQYAERYPYLEIRSHAAAISQFFATQLRLKHRLALLDEDLSLSPDERADLHQVPLVEYLWTLAYERQRLSAFDEALFRGPFDASYDLARSLCQHPEQGEGLPTFRLIIVDELHDMNATAFAILRALLQHGQSYLVAAGDSDQVIYSHMGADKRYLHEHFQAYFSDVTRFQLGRSFRYGPWLALSAGAFKQKELASGLVRETQIEVHTYAEHQQAERLLQAIRARLSTPGQSLNQCAVIMRAQHQSVALENALLMAGVPYQCLGFTPYLQRDEILFVRGLLVIALQAYTGLNALSLEGMVRALSLFGEAQLGIDAIADAQKDIVEEPAILRYFYAVRMLEYSTETAARRNRQAIEVIQQHGPQGPAAPMLAALYDGLDIEALAKRIYLDTGQAQIIAESIYGLHDLAAQHEFTVEQLHQWMTQADAFIDRGVCYVPSAGQTRRPAHVLSLLCAAQAKGTEFGHVFLPYLEQGEFPRPQQPTINEENLFYVACTRAQQSLTLFVPEGEQRQSPFVQQLQVAASQAPAQEQLHWLQQRHERLRRAAHAPQASGQPRDVGGGSAESSSTNRDPQRVYLQVPFAEKDEAKALGAYWDPKARLWYIPARVPAGPLLQRWPRHDPAEN
ncbi:MAG TPA: ATP-dependent helicase [Paenalcaligenes sp.]|nr:ATP-dependent helicase [Paenalcaligenes sp.]